MSQPLFKKVAFIGLGLIGSSLARVIVAEQLAGQIVASTRSKKTLEDAKTLGLIQYGYATPEEAVQDADLIVLALPVRATQKVLEQIKPYLTENVIITDVGSTKGNVVEAAIYGHRIRSRKSSGMAPGCWIAARSAAETTFQASSSHN